MAAVCFLLHFPYPRPVGLGWWTLSTAVSCGARTFLGSARRRPATVSPTRGCRFHHMRDAAGVKWFMSSHWSFVISFVTGHDKAGRPRKPEQGATLQMTNTNDH